MFDQSQHHVTPVNVFNHWLSANLLNQSVLTLEIYKYVQ